MVKGRWLSEVTIKSSCTSTPSIRERKSLPRSLGIFRNSPKKSDLKMALYFGTTFSAISISQPQPKQQFLPDFQKSQKSVKKIERSRCSRRSGLSTRSPTWTRAVKNLAWRAPGVPERQVSFRLTIPTLWQLRLRCFFSTILPFSTLLKFRLIDFFGF